LACGSELRKGRCWCGFQEHLLGPLIILLGWRGLGGDDAWGIALLEGNAGTQTIFALAGRRAAGTGGGVYSSACARALPDRVDPVEDDLVLTARAGRSAQARRLRRRSARIRTCRSNTRKPTSKATKQKQHCLLRTSGRAGRSGDDGGAVEWPPENSLFEVQQAVEWMLQLVHKMHEPPPRRRASRGGFSRRMMAAAGPRWIRTR
jgi:hypothetical protein